MAGRSNSLVHLLALIVYLAICFPEAVSLEPAIDVIGEDEGRE